MAVERQNERCGAAAWRISMTCLWTKRRIEQEFVRPRWPYDMRPSVRAEKYIRDASGCFPGLLLPSESSFPQSMHCALLAIVWPNKKPPLFKKTLSTEADVQHGTQKVLSNNGFRMANCFCCLSQNAMVCLAHCRQELQQKS